MTGEQVETGLKRGWDKSGVAAYAALAILLAFACGHAVSGWQSRSALVAVAETARVEREAIIKANKAQIDYLRREMRKKNEIIDKQSDQLAEMGLKGVDAAKKSSELGQQILEGSVK